MKVNEIHINDRFDYHGQTVIVLEVHQDGAEFGYFTDSIGFFRKFEDPDFPKPISIITSKEDPK